MRAYFRPLFVSLSLFAFCSCEPVKNQENIIIENASISDIEEKLQTCTKSDLVIFDCDEVLVAFTNSVFRHKGFASKWENYISDKEYTVDEMKYLRSIMIADADLEVANPKIPKIISSLREKGIDVIVLTKLGGGALGKIQSLEKWRSDSLKKMGYEFGCYSKEVEDKEFTEHTKPYESKLMSTKDYPIYKEGILYSGPLPKNETLEIFLKYSKLHPKRIIFIDDKKKYIESIQSTAENHKMNFIGLEYTEVARNNADVPEMKGLWSFQFDVLKKEKKWINDKDIKKKGKKFTYEK